MLPDCPACFEKRMHAAAETVQFHPLAGHGFDSRGWCCPEAQKASKAAIGPITAVKPPSSPQQPR